MKKREFPPAERERKWRAEALTTSEGYYSTTLTKPSLSKAILGILGGHAGTTHCKLLMTEILPGKAQTFVLMNSKLRIP